MAYLVYLHPPPPPYKIFVLALYKNEPKHTIKC